MIAANSISLSQTATAIPNLSPRFPLYHCAKHGTHSHVIASTIEGHEGVFCQICWVDMLKPFRVAPVSS